MKYCDVFVFDDVFDKLGWLVGWLVGWLIDQATWSEAPRFKAYAMWSLPVIHPF
jgi:hypothetical protein